MRLVCVAFHGGGVQAFLGGGHVARCVQRDPAGGVAGAMAHQVRQLSI